MLERMTISIALGVSMMVPVIAAAAAVARVVPTSSKVHLVSVWTTGVLLAAALFRAAWRYRHRLPMSFDGVARQRRWRAASWVLLVVFALFQLTRLAAFMADPVNTFGSAFPDPGLTNHMCMAAYVQAAALARDGDPNVYDEQHWPAFAEVGKEGRGAPSPVAELGR
jgi:hypothetical protein